MNGWITTMLRACAAWVSMVLKVEGAERARLELIVAARTSATVIYRERGRERERERERTNKINTKKTHANQTNTYG
jgi:hypothetical protein